MAEEDTKPQTSPATDDGGDSSAPQYSETVMALMKDPDGIQKLLERKSETNNEAKSYREELHAANSKLKELEEQRAKELEEAENAKLSEKERLEKQLNTYQSQLQEFQNSQSRYEQEIFSLRVKNVALAEGARDPAYVDFKLGEHLKTLDEDARKSFGDKELKEWLTGFKKENLDTHFSAPEKLPGQTRPNRPADPLPERKGGKELKKNLQNPSTFEDLAELDKEIKATIRR